MPYQTLLPCLDWCVGKGMETSFFSQTRKDHEYELIADTTVTHTSIQSRLHDLSKDWAANGFWAQRKRL